MRISRIGFASRTYRHVNRYRQILTVLFKYGFEGLVDRLRIGQYIEVGLQMISRQRRQQVEHLSAAERVRMVLEELGPTFTKLGQVLSTRPDLIPPEFVDEFSKLQEHVPPFPFDEAREIIEEDLGKPLDFLFTDFQEQSIAAASIGQVHRARLKTGEVVAVKVQRPNIRQTVEVDLEILLHLAELVEKHIEDWQTFQPRRIVEEFSRVIEREMDYTIEATHVERFANQFARDKTIYVPRVYRQTSSRRVLTLEWVDVIPITDLDRLRTNNLDPKIIAERGARLTLKQIFDHGFFHADPHPGNIFVLPENVICLLDFGMMGRLDRQAREHFAELVYCLAQREVGPMTNALVKLAQYDEDQPPDLRRLERDVSEFIDLHIPTTMGELDFGRLVNEILELLRAHGLWIPPNLVTMLKAAATVEGLTSRLDPDLNLVARAAPFVRRVRLARIRPKRIVRDTLDTTSELLQFTREIPSGIRDLVRQAKRGRLRIGFEHRGYDRMLESNERIANRVSFAIVVAALIVGSSLIVHAGIPPTWFEIPVIGLIGYLVAGAMGFILLLSIIRHGRL